MQRSKHLQSHHAEDCRHLLRLTQGPSGHLILETAPILEGSKEALLEAIKPLIQEQVLRFAGE